MLTHSNISLSIISKLSQLCAETPTIVEFNFEIVMSLSECLIKSVLIKKTAITPPKSEFYEIYI
jgi:hypothetical protein